MKKIIVILFSLILSLAVQAEPVEFKDADVNVDGVVDGAEFANSGVETEMSELDKDKDGSLSKKEYEVVFEEECE